MRLRQISVDLASDSVYWIGADARFHYVNEAACRSLGYTREELQAMTVHDIDPDFPKERWPGHWEETRKLGSLTFESIHLTKDGRIYPVELVVNHLDFDGNEYHCVFSRDITKRKRIQEQLSKSNERYHSLIQGLPVGVMSVGWRFFDYGMESLGRGDYRVFGKRGPGPVLPEVLGCLGESEYCPVRNSISRGGAVGPIDGAIRNKQDRMVPVRLRTAQLFDSEGRVMGGVEIFQDISDLKMLERQAGQHCVPCWSTT